MHCRRQRPAGGEGTSALDFGLDEAQELLQKTARDFLQQRVTRERVRAVLDGDAPECSELWGEIARLGWPGLAIPEAFGGAGLGSFEVVVVLEELGRVLAPVPFLPTALAADALVCLGTEEQRRAWLPQLAAGDARATFAIAEDAAGSEPTDLHALALSAGSGVRLRGRKLFVPDAGRADLLIVVARTEPATEEAERGLALFLVPRGTRGVRITEQPAMDRLRRLYAVELDDVELPAQALVGGRAQAWQQIRSFLDRALVWIAAEMVGGAQSCLDASVQHACNRIQFDRPIGVNQAIKHKCANMLFEVESARALVHHAAWAQDALDPDAALLAAMAKAHAGDAYQRCARENLQIHGGVGFTWDYDCHLHLKRATSDECWLGDARMHRERVARMLPL